MKTKKERWPRMAKDAGIIIQSTSNPCKSYKSEELFKIFLFGNAGSGGRVSRPLAPNMHYATKNIELFVMTY
jgi:hypothetical protein